MTIQRLAEADIEAALKNLPAWRRDGDFIRRDFSFGDFQKAFAFMTRVAFIAETRDHHPNWSNVYNRVEVALSTHDAGGITERDIGMAAAIDAIG